MSASATRFAEVVRRLEAVIHVDPGSRGIGHITLPGQLAAAAGRFAAARAVVVLTGFPCRVADSPPTETDGPPGAVALVAAALALGKRAALVTDECNAPALAAVAGAAGVAGHPGFSLHAFPPRAAWTPVHDGALAALAADYDHAVAIERSGAAGDGGYYTMGGTPMAHLVAPVDALLTVGCACGGGAAPGAAPRSSTGIGDGGNEAGMGVVVDRVRAHIRNGPLIASVTPADALVTAGVSNWGGWALVAAVEAAVRLGAAPAGAPPPPPGLPLGGLLTPPATERAIAAAMVGAGVRDGISGACDGSVDGMPLETHLGVLEALRAAVVQGCGATEGAEGA